MQPFLAGFADEIVKVGMRQPSGDRLLRGSMTDDDPTAKEIAVSGTRPSGVNYARTMLFGAIAAPLMSLVSKRIGQLVHNRVVMNAMKDARPFSSASRALRGEIKAGPIWGKAGPFKPGREPLMTAGSLATDSASGALGGSVVQAIRDKLNSDRKR